MLGVGNVGPLNGYAIASILLIDDIDGIYSINNINNGNSNDKVQGARGNRVWGPTWPPGRRVKLAGVNGKTHRHLGTVQSFHAVPLILKIPAEQPPSPFPRSQGTINPSVRGITSSLRHAAPFSAIFSLATLPPRRPPASSSLISLKLLPFVSGTRKATMTNARKQAAAKK